MATGDGIDIPINFPGADDAAGKADKLKDKVGDLGQAHERAARQAADFGGKTAAAAGFVNQFANAIGSRTLSALVQFTQQTAQGAAAGAQMGLAFGPQGALVGGIIGAALPALERLANAQRHAAEEARAHTAALQGLAQAAIQQRAAMRVSDDAASGVFGADSSSAQLQQSAELARQRVLEAERRRAELAPTLGAGGAARAAQDVLGAGSGLRERAEREARELDRTIAQQRQIIANVERETLRRQDAVRATEEQAEAAERLREEQERNRALTEEIVKDAEEAARLAQEAEAAYTERQARIAEFYDREREGIESVNRALEAQKRVLEDARAAQSRYHEERLAALAEQRRQEVEAYQKSEREAMDRMEAQQRADDESARINDEIAQREAAARDRYSETTGVIVGGLTDALSSIIAGTKTAEEAFKGLLAGFLKFISEQATLKAIYEFAEAIASAARQDWGGFGQHAAAGVAYTAVAVAAGAGSAALSASSGAAAQPQAGASSRDQEQERRGDVVLNFNSPIVTAGTRAELGREIRNTIRAGELRFGS